MSPSRPTSTASRRRSPPSGVNVVDARARPRRPAAACRRRWRRGRRATFGPNSRVVVGEPRRRGRRRRRRRRRPGWSSHTRAGRRLHEVRAPQQLAGARVDHHVVDRVDAGAVGHAPREPAGVERERGGRPVGVGRPSASPPSCAAARGRRRRRPARPAPPRPRSAPAWCPRPGPRPASRARSSTRPSRSRLTRSSLSAAAIPSTAWRQRTLVMPPTVVGDRRAQRVQVGSARPSAARLART